MKFRDIDFPKSFEYRSDSDHIPLEFYNEVFPLSKKVDLFLGYFNSGAFRVLSESFSDFHIDEIIEYIINSTWTDIVKSNKQLNDADSIKRLVGSTMVKRNIAIKHSDDKYSFTKACKLFIDFTRELIRSRANENS
jgi:hypothetical protein